jgi:dienelactone hydrolase
MTKHCRSLRGSWSRGLVAALLVSLWSAGDVQTALADPPPWDVLDGRAGEVPAEQMMVHYLLGQANQQMQQARQAMRDRTDPEQIRQWQQAMRAWFVEAIGGLPPMDTPLNARVTGTLQRDGYRVEKVLLEAQPGHYVTAALFLPDSEPFKPPYPAVLLACGHSQNGKALPGYQRGAALLALNGIAAFIFDPIDQGERIQLRDQQGRTVVWGTQAHNALGVGSMLLGNNTAQFMIHDAMRCLDYLESRADIDADRLGMTGNSGGGTQTSLVMGIERRLKAAAPSCYITDFQHWLGRIRERGDVPGDAEQNVAGQLGVGLDHWGYLVMRAPMPVLVCAATEDFFPIDGTRCSVEAARVVFQRLDAAEKIDLAETVGPHGWHTPLREATVAWMLRWLVGQEREVREPEDLEDLTEAEIQVTSTGQVMDIEGARDVYAINRDRMERLRQQRQAAWRDRGQAMWDEVRRITGIRRLEQLKVPEPRRVGQFQRDGYRVDQWVIEPEPGIVLPALAFVPDGGADQVVLWLDERGKSADAAIAGIRQRVADGQAVLAVDLRGLGETRSEQNQWYGARNGHDGANVAVAYMLGRSYVAMRAEDILVAARVARGLVAGDGGVHLVAHGDQAAIPALHAAALERGFFGAVEIRGALPSFEQIVENPLVSDQLVHTVQGALTVYDLPDLQAAID